MSVCNPRLNPQSSITLPLGVATNHLAKVKYGNGEHARITQELKYKREESYILLNIDPSKLSIATAENYIGASIM